MPNKPKKRPRPWKPERKPFARERSFYRFYNSSRWRKFSKSYRDKHPLCLICKKEGRVGPADVVDHIKGLGYLLDNGLDPYDEGECQSLCHPCHNKKSGRQAHGYKGG
ncbi:MAG: HNH endonuclease [Bacteroidota bacterium]